MYYMPLGLKDQEELEEFYEKISNGEEVETEQVSFDYDEIIGLTYKVLLNTDYYEKENGIWVDKRDRRSILKRKTSMTAKKSKL